MVHSHGLQVSKVLKLPHFGLYPADAPICECLHVLFRIRITLLGINELLSVDQLVLHLQNLALMGENLRRRESVVRAELIPRANKLIPRESLIPAFLA